MECNYLNGALADEQETIVSHVIINISPSKYNYITNHGFYFIYINYIWIKMYCQKCYSNIIFYIILIFYYNILILID